MTEEPTIVMPMPALVVLLLHHEHEKGAALTEDEVWAIRDGAESVVAPVSVAREVAQARGYDDIDPENAWAEWQAIRMTLLSEAGDGWWNT